jgi:hypothetical protein
MRLKIYSLFIILFWGFILPKTLFAEEVSSLHVLVAPLIKISQQADYLLVETNTPHLLLVKEKEGEKQTQVIENYFLKVPFDPTIFYTVISSY